MLWDAAMRYASFLSLGGHSDWWLPNRDELLGLYHSPCKSMMQVGSLDYWSSTPHAVHTRAAVLVSFRYGLVGNGDKTNSYYVRAVRAGQ